MTTNNWGKSTSTPGIILRSLLESYIWITLCVVALYFMSCHLINHNFDHTYLRLLSGGTLIIYNLHSWKKQSIQPYFRITGLILGCLLIGWGLPTIKWHHFLHLIPGVFLAINYLMWNHLKKGSFRSHPLLKPLAIALTWCWLVTGPGGYHNVEKYLVMIYVFLITLNVALLFDLKDLNYDRSVGVKTLPQLFSVRRVKQFATTALVMAVIPLIILHFYFYLPVFILLAHIKVLLIHTLLTRWIQTDFQEWKFYFYVDGILIFYGLIPWIYILIY